MCAIGYEAFIWRPLLVEIMSFPFQRKGELFQKRLLDNGLLQNGLRSHKALKSNLHQFFPFALFLLRQFAQFTLWDAASASPSRGPTIRFTIANWNSCIRSIQAA